MIWPHPPRGGGPAPTRSGRAASPGAGGGRPRRRPAGRTRGSVTPTRARCGESARGPADVAVEDGIPVTSPARTLLDLADVLDQAALARALEAADREGSLSPRELRALCERSPGRRGVGSLRRMLAGHTAEPADVRGELERASRDLCRRHRPSTSSFAAYSWTPAGRGICSWSSSTATGSTAGARRSSATALVTSSCGLPASPCCASPGVNFATDPMPSPMPCGGRSRPRPPRPSAWRAPGRCRRRGRRGAGVGARRGRPARARRRSRPGRRPA